MGDFLEKIADFLKFDRFVNMFRDHEELIMTRGLRLAAIGCVLIAVCYAVFSYIQFSRL